MENIVITKVRNYNICASFEDMKIKKINVLSEDSILGNVYIGRVENVVNNISAAFVEYEKGKKGYYSLTENTNHIFLNRKNTDKVCIGDLLLVQVIREPLKTKEPALSCKISLPGRYCAVAVKNDYKNEGLSVFISKKIEDEQIRTRLKKLVKNNILDTNVDIIMRTNASEASEDEVLREVILLNQKMQTILKEAYIRKAFSVMYTSIKGELKDIQNLKVSMFNKIITDNLEIFKSIEQYFIDNQPELLDKIEFYKDELLPLTKLYNMEKAMETALDEKVWLKSGGYLIIEPTEALTVIDVNSGKFSGNRKLNENTYLKINMEAAKEIARQLILRNLSGIIIIDFINLETKEEKKELLDYLSELVKQDYISTSVVDITKLGLVEITRKKINKPLYEMIDKKIWDGTVC